MARRRLAVLTVVGFALVTGAPAASAGTGSAGTAYPGTASAGTGTAGTASAGTAYPGTASAGTGTAGTASAGTAYPGTASAGTGTAGTAYAGTAFTGTAYPGTASAAPPVPRCVTSDPRLTELSGLATDGGDRVWAISDGGRRVQVLELAGNCSVRRVVSGSVNPYDVEDLVRAPDGTFWLADTGDNERSRSTVAMISLTPSGTSTVYRLRYPDGPHDAEAVLLGRDGVPLIVTKEPLAPAGVYRPERPLAGARSAAPIPLRKVGDVSLPSSDTEGGPIGGVGTRTVTGGATNADGTIAALRTYTDAWLFSAPNGDLVAALNEPPVRVPLPGEPQGEAVAFDGKGALLSGSESRGGVRGGLRVVPGAVALAAGAADGTEPGESPPAAGGATGGLPGWLAAGGAALLLGGAALAWRRARS